MVIVTELEQLLLLSLLSGITLFGSTAHLFEPPLAGLVNMPELAGVTLNVAVKDPIGGMEMPALPAVHVNILEAIVHPSVPEAPPCAVTVTVLHR